jgi:hypothetical protein
VLLPLNRTISKLWHQWTKPLLLSVTIRELVQQKLCSRTSQKLDTESSSAMFSPPHFTGSHWILHSRATAHRCQITKDSIRSVPYNTIRALTVLNMCLIDKFVVRVHLNQCTQGLAEDADINSEDADVVERGLKLLEQALERTHELEARYMVGVIYSALKKYPGPIRDAARRNVVSSLQVVLRCAATRI